MKDRIVLETRTATARQPSPGRAPGAELPSRQRARRTNDPFASLEMNTARGRRVGDLVRAYLDKLGHPTDVERQAAVIQAAELQVLAEEARSAALKSGTADLDQVVRVQGAADRAVRRLGIKRTEAPKGPSLAEYLAAKAPAEAAEETPASPMDGEVRRPDDDDEAAA